MKKVLDYWREYQSFLEGKSLGENNKWIIKKLY